MNPDPKRRLKLMPEVLPEPRPRTGPGDARARTISHMQRLLATVAAAGAAVGACAKEGGPTVAPLETGGTSAASKADGGSVASLDPTEVPTKQTATATATETTTAMTGYAVVDPLPMPSVCPQAAQQISATAKWKVSAGGLVVEVRISKGKGPDQITYGPQSTPSGYGGTIVSSSGPGDTKQIVIKPNTNQTSLSAAIPALCNGRGINISLGFDLQKPPKAGDAIPVTLSSY